MQGPSPGSHLPNDSHSSRHPPKATSSSPRKTEHSAPPNRDVRSAGDRLLRMCWILLGVAFVAVFGFAAVTIVLKGHPSPTSEATVPEVAQNSESAPDDITTDDPDHELLPANRNAAPSDPPAHAQEVERVLGHAFKPAPASDSLLPPPLPPPAQPDKHQPAPPPQQSDPAKTDANDPPPTPPPAKPSPSEADAVVKKRLQMSADEAREQLLAVPELRLFSDLQIETFRQTQKADEGTVRLPRDQVDYAFNVQLNKLMRQAGLKEGLPLQSGPKCQLAPDTAMVVQTLSKDLRDMGFVSVPGAAGRVRFPGGKTVFIGATTIQNGTPIAKTQAFEQWCDINKVEQFSGALPTLLQMLQVEDAPTRLTLVRELTKVNRPGATAVLAQRAMVDLSPEVRDAAVAALQKRLAAQYLPVLLQGLRYPLAPVADRAALALRKLKPQGAMPRLVALLDQPDPALPVLDKRTKKPVVRELVRLNHMRNCLLCHAPSANTKDGLVRGLVPTPGQPLPRLYYAGQSGNFVRADITFLRQDFSVNLPLEAAAPWPKEQRFDFVTRLRPARPEEIKETAVKPGNYPQRDAVLYALRGLTGKDAGDSSAKWRELLGIAREKDTMVKDKNPSSGQTKETGTR